jgi:pyridoxamine 5'-phosphate oxidase family protein
MTVPGGLGHRAQSCHPRRPFTDEEIAYLQSQPLARLATVNSGAQPDVVPVAFEFDDLVSFNPFIARGIRVYGDANGPVERVG